MSLKKNSKIKYEFVAKIWQHSGQGGWYFVSLPQDIAKEIRDHLKSEEEGWGRLKATAKIGKCEWDTAIWFSTKLNTYILPLKVAIRKKENLIKGKTIQTIVWI